MTTLDWSQCPAVESIPGKVSGAWVFKGYSDAGCHGVRELGSGLDRGRSHGRIFRHAGTDQRCIAFRGKELGNPSRPRCIQRLSMFILFDHGTPRSIARWLHGHTVEEAIVRGWDRLANGALLKAAEEAGFDLLLSTDKNIQYQQTSKVAELPS